MIYSHGVFVLILENSWFLKSANTLMKTVPRHKWVKHKYARIKSEWLGSDWNLWGQVQTDWVQL